MKAIASEEFICGSCSDIESHLSSALKDQSFEIPRDNLNIDWLRRVPEKVLDRNDLLDVAKLHLRSWLIRPGEEFHWFKLGPHTYRYSPEGLRLCIRLDLIGVAWLDGRDPDWRVDLNFTGL